MSDFCDPVNCSPLASSVHGISQARILEGVAIFFSRGSPWPRDRTCVSNIGRWILYHSATRQACITGSSVQFSSVAQSCLTLCDPMNHSTKGLLVHDQLPEFTQTHIHRVHDAIQPSRPLLSCFPPAPNPFQHQSLFQ